jgi:hypothetical protein
MIIGALRPTREGSKIDRGCGMSAGWCVVPMPGGRDGTSPLIPGAPGPSFHDPEGFSSPTMKILPDHAGDPVVRLPLTYEKRLLRCITTNVRDAPQTHVDLEPSPVGQTAPMIMEFDLEDHAARLIDRHPSPPNRAQPAWPCPACLAVAGLPGRAQPAWPWPGCLAVPSLPGCGRAAWLWPACLGVAGRSGCGRPSGWAGW